MPDFAISSDPAVQAQLDRLTLLSPGADILGLGRITELLGRLGNPHHRLPPTFHVAGTNGKGSTCAFLRAALEADGRRVHVYSSPHLVRFNERIRLAGTLIDDAMLARLLERVLNVAEGIGASFFEVTTAAAFLAFAEIPADACVIEVGLGGRLDATNVLTTPIACGIAQLGVDHQAFLGSDPAGIAREKAGIAKRAVPLLTQAYPSALVDAIAEAAGQVSAPVLSADKAWHFERGENGVVYRDAWDEIALPLPRLPGTHQSANLALAVAMLRYQSTLQVSEKALHAAALDATWPARLQRLDSGPLPDLLPRGSELWLDGGHNPAAGEMLGRFFANGGKLHLILGMLSNKDASGFLAPLADHIAQVHAIPVEGHAWHQAESFAAMLRDQAVPVTAHAHVEAALKAIAQASDRSVTCLIAGSLYLAGDVLRRNGQLPQ